MRITRRDAREVAAALNGGGRLIEVSNAVCSKEYCWDSGNWQPKRGWPLNRRPLKGRKSAGAHAH